MQVCQYKAFFLSETLYHLSIYLRNPDLVCLRPEDCGLDGPVDDVGQEGHCRHEDETEPEDGTGEHHLEHSRHVAGEGNDRPYVTVDRQEEEPEDDAAPDAGVAHPSPGVHLDSGLETGGDDDQGVDGVAQHQVVVSPAAAPLHAGVKSSEGQPEKQYRVIDRDPNPLPELFNIEQFRVLAGLIEAWELLPGLGCAGPVEESQGDGREGGE